MTVVDEIVKREVGERVDVLFNIDQNTVKSLADGTFSAVVTTSTIDRMGESIVTDGIDTTAYMAGNPVVLYGHDYSALPIGKTISLKSTKNKMTATFQLAVNEYPFAKTVSDLIAGGYLGAVSIGGIVRQWDPSYTVIEQMEMVEFSVVPVPANAQALIARSFEKITGKSTEQINQEFQEFATKSIAKSMKTIDSEEITGYIETLEKLLVILKATSKGEETDGSKIADEKITLTLRKTGGKLSQTGQDIIKLTKRAE